MTDTSISWERIRGEAANVSDKLAEIRRITEWSEDGTEDHIERFQEQCLLKDRDEALKALLEVCLMRRQIRISEELSEELKLDITVTMWLRRWSADEFKKALSEIFSRVIVSPATAEGGIHTLLEIAVLYRQLRVPSLWSSRKDRGSCAELMFLTHRDEDTIHTEMLQIQDRFGFGKGHEADALNAIREMELLYRRTPFDSGFPERFRRILVEMMWLRQWTLQEALQYAGTVESRLQFRNDALSVKAAYEICLLHGPKSYSGPVHEAAKQICPDDFLNTRIIDETRALLAEYLWVGKYSVGQAMERLGRFGRVNNASLRETLDVLLQLERDHFRENAAKPDTQRT